MLVQLGQAGILLPIWGLQLYGEWIILVGIAVAVGSSDFGYISAAVSDMTMAVSSGNYDRALDVFRSVAKGLAVVFAVVLVLAVVAVFVLPVGHLLGLKLIHGGAASAIVMLIAVEILLMVSSLLLYGGFCCVGRYGEGVMWQSGIIFGETASACVAAAAGAGPLVATAAIAGVRIAGTLAMYAAMRRRTPWLSIGRPTGTAQVTKRLTGPALAMAFIGWGTVINVQLSVVIVGVVIGPASAAIFSTVRTLSRVVLQITASIGQAVGPELSKAFAQGNQALASRLQRRVTQTSVWALVALSLALAATGPWIISAWTRGRVHEGGWLLYLLLISGGLEGAWLTAGSILFFTNRHQRIGVSYAVLSIVGLPVTYLLAVVGGRNGVAVWLVAVSGLMLLYVLRCSLPLLQESLGGWVRSLVDPHEVRGALRLLRAQLLPTRRSAAPID